jgi:outer membrane receptor for ferrienterochelin and colicins
MKKIITLFFTVITITSAYSQTIKGTVAEKKEGKIITIPGVNIIWEGTHTGTVSNSDGSFELAAPESFPAKLVFSFVGFRTDTVTVKDFSKLNVTLKSSLNLEEVEVSARTQSTAISTIAPINTEYISTKELRKAACCNLAESFDTNASVDVSYTDAVSGARQIQMLGLDGTYSQLLSENIPSVRGLAASYGLAFIPGTWIESISVSKGAGSVVNGYESMAGQINVEFHKPEEAEKIFFNTYVNHLGRYEANLHVRNIINNKWSSLTFLHGSAVTQKIDMNRDGFLDTPLQRQLNVFNRWKYDSGKRLVAQFGVKALADERTGGQVAYNPSEDYGTTNAYGIGINSKQFEAFSKAALNSQTSLFRSVGLITNFRHYKQNSYFGFRHYNGEQNTLYMNLIYQDILSTSDHKIKTGASFLNDHYTESFNDSMFSRTEIVPGVFAEYQYEIENKISLLAGIRGDYHNMFGFFPTPRFHLKYNLLPKTVLRGSAGRGFRVANAFAENSAVLASSRSIHSLGTLKPEIAWSMGGGITHNLCLGTKGFVINVDYYRTDFENQVVVDFDKDIRSIYFYNLEGRSYANSFQAEVILEASKSLEFKTAYKFYDVKSTFHGNLLERPLISRHRMLFNTTYYTKFDKWKFDFTAKWYGATRIPGHGHENTGDNHVHLPARSPHYWILLGQITRSFKNFDVYFGGENLTNFMQHRPVIASEDPFGPNFDASLVWGPLMGRMFYAGMRWTIK